MTDYTVSLSNGSAFTEAGKQTITVTYGGKTADFEINVKDVILKNIVLNTASVKKSYYQNETLDLAELVVTANYTDGSSKIIEKYSTNLENESVLSTLGNQIITVTYQNQTSSFEITVKKNYLSVIKITVPEYFNINNLLIERKGKFIAASGYSSYQWMLDGEFLGTADRTYSPDQDALAGGYHELLLIVKTAEGKSYSATASFLIQK